jgi:hypothetical protein
MNSAGKSLPATPIRLCRGGARSARSLRLAAIDRGAFPVGAQHAAPQARTQQTYLPQSWLSFFSVNQTASQHNFPPATHLPRANSSHNPNPPDAIDAQTHLHSETGAASTSATTRISAPSNRAANKHPNIDPILRSTHVCRNQRAPASKRERRRQQDSILSLPSAERCAPRRRAKTISHGASVRRQNSASASRLFAESLRRATQIHRASQIASEIPPRCDRRTTPRYFHRARIADTAVKSPATAC